MSVYKAGFFVVKVSDLPQTPKTFQDYVEKYFQEVKWRGEMYYIAAKTLDASHIEEYDGKGVAPISSMERFKDGLPENTSLGEWIEKHPEIVLNFSKEWGSHGLTAHWDD